MNFSLSDIDKLLRGNPDLRIDDPYIYQPVTPLAMAVPVVKTERDLQKAVIDECDRRAFTNPVWALIFAVPNGQYRQGQRMEPGLKAGVPDLFWPVARDHPCGKSYHGLFIELKVGSNPVSAVQSAWMMTLQDQGYCCHVVRDHIAAVMSIMEWYLEGK